MKLLEAMEVMADRFRALTWRLLGARLAGKVRVGARSRWSQQGRLQIGTRSWLESDVYIKLVQNHARVTMGSHVFLARFCTLDCAQSIQVGDHCMFGPGCTIVDHNHGVHPDKRMDEQPCPSEPVVIGSDVWCGAGVVILPGVCIGDGAVIGANAVVNRDVAPGSIVAGVPARVVGRRENRIESTS